MRTTSTPARVRAKKRLKKKTKGYRGARGRLLRSQKETLLRAGAFAFRDRRVRRRELRSLWIVRLNAAAREYGLRYSEVIAGLRHAGIEVNRKILSEMAIHDRPAFKLLLDRAKAALYRGEQIDPRTAHSQVETAAQIVIDGLIRRDRSDAGVTVLDRSGPFDVTPAFEVVLTVTTTAPVGHESAFAQLIMLMESESIAFSPAYHQLEPSHDSGAIATFRGTFLKSRRSGRVSLKVYSLAGFRLLQLYEFELRKHGVAFPSNLASPQLVS